MRSEIDSSKLPGLGVYEGRYLPPITSLPMSAFTHRLHLLSGSTYHQRTLAIGIGNSPDLAQVSVGSSNFLSLLVPEFTLLIGT